jgi:hypothetical protein
LFRIVSRLPIAGFFSFVSFPQARLQTATLMRSPSFTTSTASHHLLEDMDTLPVWNIALFEGGRVDDVLGPMLDGSRPSHQYRVTRCCIRCDCLEAPCYVHSRNCTLESQPRKKAPPSALLVAACWVGRNCRVATVSQWSARAAKGSCMLFGGSGGCKEIKERVPAL